MKVELVEKDLTCEAYREYDIPGRDAPYCIYDPKKLIYRPGGSTHRIVDSAGVTHCVPAPGVAGCVLRWKSIEASTPVNF